MNHHYSTSETNGRLADLNEIKRGVNSLHLSYLNTEDTPEKLEYRAKLEGLLVEYLSMAPHRHKLGHKEISHCLTKSIYENKDFSAYKAANTFETLEKYATNLLTFPWRREYKTINLYNGHYKHIVERQLIGGETILKLIGYRFKNCDINNRGMMKLDESPIDPDILAQISLDCLICYVEIQMIIQIKEALKRKGISCSWFEIYSVRVDYVCGMEDVVDYIIETKLEKKLIDYESPSPSLSSKYSIINSYVQNDDIRNGWSLVGGHNCKPKKQVLSSDEFDYVCDEALNRNESFDLMTYPVTNNHLLPIPPPRYASMVTYPIPPPSIFANPYHQLLQPRPQTVNRSTQAGPVLDNVTSSVNRLSLNSMSKGDASCGAPVQKNALPLTSNKSEDHRTNRRDSCTRTLQNAPSSSSPVCEEVTKFHSLDKNTSATKTSADKKRPQATSSTTLPSAKGSRADIGSRVKGFDAATGKFPQPEGRITSKSDDINIAMTLPSASSNKKVVDHLIKQKWSCVSCTYINTSSQEICEMCSRSRIKGPEETPLICGGRECPRCTLVNQKDAGYCSACNASLADSPTYI